MFRQLFLRLPIICVFAFSLSVFAGDLTGKVLDKNGNPVMDASVRIIELKQKSRVDIDGSFTFQSVPEGSLTLRIDSASFGTLLKAVEMGSDSQSVDITFDITIHEDVTVTATPEAKSISDVSQAVSSLGERELMEKMANTLGETLANEPGLSSTWFGPGSSRPVIRGLGGERIRVLEGGLGTGDVSTVSVDHAITADPLTTERIEILRGPASLRYGASAVGGVVNVIDNRIPEYLTQQPVTGTAEVRTDTVSDQQAGAISLNGSKNRFAWHADLSFKDSDDIDVPGFADIDGPEEEDAEEGILENSATETQKGSVGFSFIGDRGFIGVSVTGLDTEYGVPGHAEGHGGHDEGHDEDEEDEHHDDEEEGHDDDDDEEGHDEEEEEFVSIDMEQKRYEVRGGLNLDGTLKALNVRLATTDYEHVELEGDEIGTEFTNEYTELRAELTNGQLGAITSGSFGVQYSDREFSAIGAEAFVPPNDTRRFGAYVYQEVARPNWILSFGGRYENQTNEGTFREHHHEDEEEEHHDDEEEEEHHDDEEGEEHHDEEEGEVEAFDLDFNGVSASVGFLIGRQSDYSLSASLTRTERAPNAEELFSNGPHLATRSFEVGDPTLDKETSTGFDVQLRKKYGRVTGELSFFVNQFDDYIYEQATGEEEDGLDEFEFLQQDADFTGGEIHLDFALIHRDPDHLHLEFFYDLVNAELDNGQKVARIPPEKMTIALRYNRPSFWARAEMRHTDEQTDIAPFETVTDDFTFFNVSAGYRFFFGTSIHQLVLRGTNLGDEEGRVHTSFLKDLAPLPGRNISLAYRLTF